MGHSMGASYYSTKEFRDLREKQEQEENDRVAAARRKLAAKIVMAVVDKVVAEIIRPGPVAEERECYDMAGELRAAVPGLEDVAKAIIDVEEGVE